jgi:hypothetical protein
LQAAVVVKDCRLVAVLPLLRSWIDTGPAVCLQSIECGEEHMMIVSASQRNDCIDSTVATQHCLSIRLLLCSAVPMFESNASKPTSLY